MIETSVAYVPPISELIPLPHSIAMSRVMKYIQVFKKKKKKTWKLEKNSGHVEKQCGSEIESFLYFRQF